MGDDLWQADDTGTDAPTPSMRLVAVSLLAAGGRWRIEAMRAYPEPLLLWFTRGQGRITLAGSTRGFTAHNAVFIPAGVMHGLEPGPQTFGTAVFFGNEAVGPLPAQPHLLRIRDAPAQQEANVLIDTIQREWLSAQPGADRAARLHLGLLAVWLERQIARAAPDEHRPDAARRLVARYTALLEHSFRSGAGIGGLAATLGVTPTHLSRCCKQACGRTALELLQDRRLFEARRLLAETNLPIGRIGESLGFSSAGHFTRAFRSGTGTNPAAFRRDS